MLRTLLIALALSLFPTVPLLAADLPKPDRNGNYSGRTSHPHWVVIDSDRNGLNCRWFSTTPTDWYSPTTKLPLATINQWQAIRRFKRNAALTANTTPAGFATIADTQNRPWLKVNIGPNNQICLVRANAKYIRPFQQ